MYHETIVVSDVQMLRCNPFLKKILFYTFVIKRIFHLKSRIDNVGNWTYIISKQKLSPKTKLTTLFHGFGIMVGLFPQFHMNVIAGLIKRKQRPNNGSGQESIYRFKLNYILLQY